MNQKIKQLYRGYPSLNPHALRRHIHNASITRIGIANKYEHGIGGGLAISLFLALLVCILLAGALLKMYGGS